MGEVWRATDLELRRVVALKLARTGNGEETRREARVGAGVHHPNVISVFDVVVDGDRQWLVMEYLPARSLAEINREDGPLAPGLTARIGAQLAAALSAMHAKGMVHRDITPANVLVTEDGTAKLADLGIAMWDMVTMTGSASSAGTPGYVAPEVLKGYRATAASDIYSLGVTLSGAVEGHPESDEHLTETLSVLTDPDPDRRPTADKAVKLLGGSRTRRLSRRMLVSSSLGLVVALAATFLITSSGSEGTPSGTPRRSAAPTVSSGKLLFGMGDHINQAMASDLVQDSPVGMLATNYHKPGDLPGLAGWQHTLVPDAYARGYALHLTVSSWDADDPEMPVETKYGPGCGRTYVLSPAFLENMRELARIFAGRAEDPPLYVSMFQETSRFACGENGMWANSPATANYYRALKDQYLAAMQIFHDVAPNARVAMGWSVWQASIDDDVMRGGGQSMFAHFADVMSASDFQSVVVKEPFDNSDDIRQTVRILSEYGRVMVSSYGNKDMPPEVVEEDMRELLTDESIDELIEDGLFAWSFNDEGVLDRAGKPTIDLVKDVVRRTGQGPV
jgi:serine/threonine protein kinase